MGASIAGRSAATAATAGHAICGLWNPSGTKRVKVVEIGLFKQGGAGAAGDALELRRSTARGTPGSSVTGTIEHDHNRDLAPSSGMILDLAAYTVQPTLAAGALRRWPASAVQAAGILLPLREPIVMPPGTGLILATIAATAWPASDLWFACEDA